jgi:hypothetical protein
MAHTSLQQRRWFPTGQPQTLQIAVALLYWNAVLSLLFGVVAGGFGLLELVVLGLDVAGAFGVANERKWGYLLAVVAAFAPLALLIAVGGSLLAGGLLNLVFQIALIALLLHPMSRSYYKLWFR